ncbi:hypothetical protein Tco_0133738 [Tanacetum coccineum]
MDAAIQNQGASIKTLEIQIGQMSKVLQERGFGSLPSSTKANPRDQVKSISTTIEADSCPIRRIGSSQYVVSTGRNRTLMYETRQTKILFPGRLNGYYCEEKKGLYRPQFLGILEDMDAYHDEGLGDVIFSEPFLREVGIKARRIEGMITIYNGNDEVTYQMVRSHPRTRERNIRRKLNGDLQPGELEMLDCLVGLLLLVKVRKNPYPILLYYSYSLAYSRWDEQSHVSIPSLRTSWKMNPCALKKDHSFWPSITVDGATSLKEYIELTPAEAIQADCDIKAIIIILQGLPTEI